MHTIESFSNSLRTLATVIVVTLVLVTVAAGFGWIAEALANIDSAITYKALLSPGLSQLQ